MSRFDTLWSPLPEHARRAAAPQLVTLEGRLRGSRGEAPTVDDVADLLDVLLDELRIAEARATRIGNDLAVARSAGREQAALARLLDDLGSSPADRRALGRSMGVGAVLDRLGRQVHGAHQRWQLLAEAAAALPCGTLAEPRRILILDGAAEVLAGRARPWPVRVAAARLMVTLCAGAGPGAGEHRQSLLETALDLSDDPWVQAEALRSWAELGADPADARSVVSRVLHRASESPAPPSDHRFVRARAAVLAGDLGDWSVLREVFSTPEDSEHVLMRTVQALARSPRPEDATWLVGLVTEQALPVAVRATVVLSLLPNEIASPEIGEAETPPWMAAVEEALGRPETAGVVAEAVLERLLDDEPIVAWAQAARLHWGPALQALVSRPGDLGRVASALTLGLRVRSSSTADAAYTTVRSWAATTPAGSSRTFRDGPVSAIPPETLLDVLALVAERDMDLSADPLREPTRGEGPRAYRLYRDARPRLSLWRVAHELEDVRPDKRQAHSHLTDRTPPGRLYAPSARMVDVTETRVPGARVADGSSLDWAPELPLASTVVAAARRGEVRCATAREQYVVRRQGPSALKGWLLAQRHYARLSALRERVRQSPPSDAQATFDAELQRLGFVVERTPRSAERSTPSVTLPALPLGAAELLREAVALDSNSIEQLAALSAALLGGWLGGRVLHQRSVRRLRSRIPLVVGGWGSRGKSGTERLKVGLFLGLGYSVLCKTTGCEAMIVAGLPGQEPVEIYLYRPYDRASIAEQLKVLRLAADLEVQVLLWECMALNPRYVEILQSGWMRDDLSTITNTYPDHEDVMGPTGRDVAEAIGRFVPPRTRTFTTEQHMTPVLQDAARSRGTSLRVVRPERWRLLPADLTSRLPYDEHPRNLALVLDLAAELGVPDDVALRAMADHVLPDLGVLKEYGPFPYEQRTVSFVNGMSANERAGFLANWRRSRLGTFDETEGLSRWTTVLVNNRADRLARQGVFAELAAVDAPADTLAVIGTNVGPFVDEYTQALERVLRPRLVEAARSGGREGLVDALIKRLRRRPHRRVDAVAVVHRELDLTSDVVSEAAEAAYGLNAPAPATVRFTSAPGDAAARWLAEVAWLHFAASGEGSDAQIIDEAIALIASRTLPLRDSSLTGDQVLHRVVTASVEGARLRILGSCNIKGTGLGLVYRVLSTHKVMDLVEGLASSDLGAVEAALRSLVAHDDWGVADSRIALPHLRRLEEDGRVGRTGLGMEVASARARLDAVLREREAALAQEAGRTWWARITRGVAMNFDLADSIRRRRQADRLLTDLGAHRVGLRRAAEVARALTERQKHR
ncbi:MAG: hypothetical protein KDA24_03925 [Deltaproteobacteria bacterium]|nr:hypothetical protein [Deltaproteobacteria bacterium]